jgi:hypothetical protein
VKKDQSQTRPRFVLAKATLKQMTVRTGVKTARLAQIHAMYTDSCDTNCGCHDWSMR